MATVASATVGCEDGLDKPPHLALSAFKFLKMTSPTAHCSDESGRPQRSVNWKLSKLALGVGSPLRRGADEVWIEPTAFMMGGGGTAGRPLPSLTDTHGS